MSGGVTIKIDTSELEKALDRLQSAQGRDAADIVKYNAKKLLKAVAWITKRADKGNVPKRKLGRVGRLRAGWYASWKGLGLAGMAYSTPGAVQKGCCLDFG